MIDQRTAPFSRFSRRRNALKGQSLCYLAHCEAALHIVVEDAADYDSSTFFYLQVRRHAVSSWNPQVTERHRRNNLTTASAVEFAAPMSLSDLGALELGHCARNLVH